MFPSVFNKGRVEESEQNTLEMFVPVLLFAVLLSQTYAFRGSLLQNSRHRLSLPLRWNARSLSPSLSTPWKLLMRDDSKASFPSTPTPMDPDAYILPPGLDLPYIKALTIGQLILIGFVLILKFITGDAVIPPIGSFHLDTESLKMALSLSVPLIIAGFTLDNLPLEFAKEINRSTKLACVRMLGRTSSYVIAASTALVLSVSTGISEEMFFRGFLFPLFDNFAGPLVATIASSLIFGIAHFPFTLGPPAIVETLIGEYTVLDLGDNEII